MKAMRILVVEDEHRIAHSLQKGLEQERGVDIIHNHRFQPNFHLPLSSEIFSSWFVLCCCSSILYLINKSLVFCVLSSFIGLIHKIYGSWQSYGY